MTEEQGRIYSSYVGKGFDSDQLDEIRRGIEDGIDVSTYAIPGMKAAEMSYVRKKLNYDRSIMRDVVASEEKVKPDEHLDTRTRHEKMADLGQWLGEASIALGAIAIMLIVLGVI